MASVALAVLFIFAMTFVIWWLMKYMRLRNIIEQIHGPRSYFLFGNLPQFKADPDDWFEQATALSTKYQNPRMCRIWLMWDPYLFIYGADESEPILSSNRHLNKSKEYEMLQPWMGLGLLTNYAEKWRPRRKLLTPTFHYDILKDFVDVYNQQAKILISKLEKKTGQGRFDIYPFITLCALDIICESAMGRHVNAQQNKNSDYVRAIYLLNQIIHERQKSPWLWPDWTFNKIGRGKEHAWCLDVIHSFTKRVINERWNALKERNVNVQKGEQEPERAIIKKRLAFLDLLIDMSEKGELTFEDVCDEVNTFMFEGHDTTSAGMNWTLHLLGCYPEIQAKVHQELDSIFGDDRDINFEDLKNLPYLERCLKESLRLFPSVPLFTRRLEEDAIIGGKLVPGGTSAVIYPYAVHRDPKHWPDPEAYNPDRFLPENVVGRHPFAYLPFSAGSRNCIGQRFALMEEKTVIAWILRYYTVNSVNRRDHVRPKGELILRPAAGVHVELQLRRRPNFE